MQEKENIESLLQSFDRSQKSALEKYLQSPYFKIDDSVIDWLSEWLLHENESDGGDFLWELLKKSKVTLLKKVQEACLGFLAQYHFDSLAAMKVNLNLEGIRKRNIDKLYKDTLGIIEKLPVTEFDQSSDYFYYRALIEKNIFELKTENEKKNAKVKIASELNMHKISENIDLFYILELMKNTIHDLATQPDETKILALTDDLTFCLMAAEEYGEKYPTVRLYADFIKIHSRPKFNQAAWDEWQKRFRDNIHKIPEKEHNLLQAAVNRFMKKNDS